MEFEPWWLLVPVLAFVLGWFIRGFDTRLQARSSPVPQSMFRGLNLLLNEQPDQAIDAFIEVVRLDPETIELHYALGSLFRRRGEFDRAIRIHNYLLNRADLPARERAKALAELAQDYLKAGLLDRADEAFSRLVDDPPQRFAALRALLGIRETLRDWPGAIATARKLEAEAGESRGSQIAHFHDELAQKALDAGELVQAQKELDAARGAQRDSMRTALLLGSLRQRQGRPEEAIRIWLDIARPDNEAFNLVAGPLTAALGEAGRRDEALDFLHRGLAAQPSIDLLDLACERTRAWRGDDAADQLLREQLASRPSLAGYERWLARRVAAGDQDLEPLRGLLHTWVARVARYRCRRCGFRAREYHWRCPGCQAWDSYPPRRAEEADAVS